MATIRVHEFLTLDGVIDNPAWSLDYAFDPMMGPALAAVMAGCEGILLGRRTYEMFEPAWSVRTAEADPGAPFMNDTTKFVVSSTLGSPTWRNTKNVGPYDPEVIRELKGKLGGGIYVSGSGTLVRALLADGLVDELHLFVYPLTTGAGHRLFSDGLPPIKWHLAASEAYENGAVYLFYRRPE